jgi:hypothetical protein
MRKTIKASVALLIATIFFLDTNTRSASGESVLLVAIVVIFYFPVRTIGNFLIDIFFYSGLPTFFFRDSNRGKIELEHHVEIFLLEKK